MIVIRYEYTTGNKYVVADQDLTASTDMDEVINLDVTTKGDATGVRPCIQSDHVAADKAFAKADLALATHCDRQPDQPAGAEQQPGHQQAKQHPDQMKGSVLSHW